jgi:hypothetical protein
MNIEQLSTMTEAELYARANSHLEYLDREESDWTKELHVSQAQVYFAEIARREQVQERIESKRIAKRDFRLEVSVIVLIGAELLIALLSFREGTQQTQVLDKLNKSSADTAAILMTLREEQEASLESQKHTLENLTAMNSALQDEMDLNFTEALRYSGGEMGGAYQRIDFSNYGKATLFFWGTKFDGELPRMQKMATVLTPAKSVSLDVSDVVKRFIERKSLKRSIPYELYFTRQNGTKYISKGNLQLDSNNNVVIFQQPTAERKQW